MWRNNHCHSVYRILYFLYLTYLQLTGHRFSLLHMRSRLAVKSVRFDANTLAQRSSIFSLLQFKFVRLKYVVQKNNDPCSLEMIMTFMKTNATLMLKSKWNLGLIVLKDFVIFDNVLTKSWNFSINMDIHIFYILFSATLEKARSAENEYKWTHLRGVVITTFLTKHSRFRK